MQYEAPTTLDDALRLLAGASGNSRILAGGTDLLVRVRTDMEEPDTIIDIKRIEGISAITRDDAGWHIGAAASGAEMGENAELVAEFPGVVEGVNLIGSTQVQGRATMAGNLCNASPAADGVPAMVAVGAIATVAGPNGTREVAVKDIPTGPGKTSLASDEIITSILLPARPERSSDAYLRFIPRTEMDIAVVGCGVSLTLDESGTCTAARVALGAVAPTVIEVPAAADALIGTKVDEAALEAVAAACSAAASPISDKRGTAEYRTHVAGVLARRATSIALKRAGGGA